MKRILFVSILALLSCTTAISCKKSVGDTTTPHEEAWWRILAIDESFTDTTTSTAMQAREQTFCRYIDQDDYLQIKVLGYVNGKYAIEVKNKQNAWVDLWFLFTNLNITAVSPNRSNSMSFNKIGPRATEVFYFTGALQVGKIKVKALTIEEWKGEWPEWLEVCVDNTILPITYLENKARYDKNKKATIITFKIDDPTKLNKFIFEKLVGTEWTHGFEMSCDKVRKEYEVIIFDDEQKTGH